ncbi:hypothetical protein OIU84_027923 [Salix udensis]|uniref:Uncharacterized protein n=1 Tax=Salix udensis TaxID=889485 RepID=A0AAD6KBG3_9ROSI|nr:hypothetical protein OIU84_027923 [Salix udensis]
MAGVLLWVICPKENASFSATTLYSLVPRNRLQARSYNSKGCSRLESSTGVYAAASLSSPVANPLRTSAEKVYERSGADLSKLAKATFRLRCGLSTVVTFTEKMGSKGLQASGIRIHAKWELGGFLAWQQGRLVGLACKAPAAILHQKDEISKILEIGLRCTTAFPIGRPSMPFSQCQGYGKLIYADV